MHVGILLAITVAALCLECQFVNAADDATTQPPKSGKEKVDKLPLQAKVKHVHKVSFGITAPKAVVATAPPTVAPIKEQAASQPKAESKKP